MSRLNGLWIFFYSEEQAQSKDYKTFVEVDGELKEYTEGVHALNTQRSDYIPHKDRFKDSVLVDRVLNPIIKRERDVKMAKKYRKKPVVVEAVQYKDGSPENLFEIEKFAGDNVHIDKKAVPPLVLIHTPEGTMEAKPGDYIIKGVNGEFYPCKPDIFEKTYEKVE